MKYQVSFKMQGITAYICFSLPGPTTKLTLNHFGRVKIFWKFFSNYYFVYIDLDFSIMGL